MLTLQNAAMVVIDYQPSLAAVRSTDPDLLLENIVSIVKTAKAFGVPIVHSTVNVASGRGQPTVPELAGLLEDNAPIDRTSQPISWVALACELQRDWAREETVADVVKIVLTE